MVQANTTYIKNWLQQLANFSDTPNEGVTRLSFTPTYKQAAHYLIEEMKKLGLKTHVDRFGNVIGRSSSHLDLPPVVIGSHLDTVTKGGAFDGTAGIVAGLEVARMFQQQSSLPVRPFEVIAFVEEEGGRFENVMMGSRAMTGDLKEEEFLKTVDDQGITIEKAMETIEFERENKDGVRTREDIAAFLELHIEQDTSLEEENIHLGIVETIGGFEQFHIDVRGKRDHAGTTPMNERADALVTASKMIGTFPTLIKDFEEDGTVLTVGSLNVSPNGKNVIPDRAHFTIDLRSHTAASLDEATERILRFIELHESDDIQVTIERLFSLRPKALDGNIQALLEACVKRRGYTSQPMKSRAGHDAMTFASFVPTGLLFVPSKDGISHTKEEWTDIEDIARGVNVLFDTVYELTKDENML